MDKENGWKSNAVPTEQWVQCDFNTNFPQGQIIVITDQHDYPLAIMLDLTLK